MRLILRDDSLKQFGWNKHLYLVLESTFAKLQHNSQLHLHFNPTPSPHQVNSTPPRVELELCLIFGFACGLTCLTCGLTCHHITSPYYFTPVLSGLTGHPTLHLTGNTFWPHMPYFLASHATISWLTCRMLWPYMPYFLASHATLSCLTRHML